MNAWNEYSLRRVTLIYVYFELFVFAGFSEAISGGGLFVVCKGGTVGM